MKVASVATQNILAVGQYLKIEFFKFVLPKLGTFYFTNADASLTVGGITYLTGLTFTRTQFTHALGLAVQSLTVAIEPQADNPAGPVKLAGVAFLTACANGGFDGGVVTVSKGFFNAPASGQQLDVSPGIVPWFVGLVDQVDAGRFSVDLTINDAVQILNVQMPRNILQAGCVHTLFDAGCTLSKATYTVAKSITGGVTFNTLQSGATNPDGYFNLGVIAFTSGVLAGSSYTIKTYLLANGFVQATVPWNALPAPGDTFTLVPGCDKSQGTCASKFNNVAHYRGAPYVPQPETLYDGGTSASTAPTLGRQGGQGAGSPVGGARGPGTYKP